jgi:hypothetical protein
MFKTIQKIQEFKTQLNVEKIYNGFIVFIIVLILLLATLARYRPIDTHRIITVQKIALQSMYPETQEMALHLLGQEKISLGQYLKLMQAHQVEMTQAIQLPPVSEEEY